MDFTQENTSETAAAQLRLKTRPLHDQVDALYSRFDLSAGSSYGDFLKAQYRAVAGAETALAPFSALPAWRARTGLLADDLRQLGLELPKALRIDLVSSSAQAHGVLYVLEGSRLGGRLLIRAVGPGLPSSFLADGHEPGEWRRFLAELNQYGAASPDNLRGMVVGAESGFGLFLTAAVVTP
jgi:heme oxygenase